ncbi:MAG: hypothetical protein JWP79_263 [Polaromonas sp.]|nr:hypothetical protein [Polaromonas sp.]
MLPRPCRLASRLPLLAAALLSLSACGGGDSGPEPGPGASVSVQASGYSEQKKPSHLGNTDYKAESCTAGSALSGQPVLRVNTTQQGDQVLRSLGAVDEDGFTVAWLSGSDGIFMQRFDSAGAKMGGETQLQLDIRHASESLRAGEISVGSVAVLRDGSVVVSYPVARPANPSVPNDQSLKDGIYFQRFDSTGAQVVAETEVFSRTFVPNYRPPGLGNVKAVALADGGFAIGWASIQPSSVTIRTTFSVRRYDGAGQAEGESVVVGVAGSPGTSTYAMKADAFGGYAVVASQQREDYTPMFSLTYFDTGNAPQPVPLPGGTTDALLLPLESGRFALFGQGNAGAYRQFLDSGANPVGAQSPLSVLPLAAQALADGSHATFTAVAAGVSAQRFDSEGMATGESVLIAAQGGAPVSVVALPDGGFAAAWTAAGALADQDVFAQRFTVYADPVHAGAKARRKACKESAVGQGLKGRARKQFMDGCLKQ